MTPPIFRLFWLRESGCDAGVLCGPGELEPSICERVMKLEAGEGGEFALRLPYMDRHQWRRRSEILSKMRFERAGRIIRATVSPSEATRDTLAVLTLIDPLWKAIPPERALTTATFGITYLLQFSAPYAKRSRTFTFATLRGSPRGVHRKR